MSMKNINIQEETLEISIETAVGSEAGFTDDFLMNPKQMQKVIECIGMKMGDAEICKQVSTTDGKSLDNLVITEDGQRIAIESQLGRSDMNHVAKLPYYMENLRNEGELLKGILIAEEFNQEAIDYYEALNNLEFFDLYLVKAVFIKVDDENAVFKPILISPTPTSNILKEFKLKQTNYTSGIPHEENKKLVCNYLDLLKINYNVSSAKNGDYKFRFKQKGYSLSATVRTTGSITICGCKNHPNEEVFTNRQKRYFILKDSTSPKNFEEWKCAFQVFINAL